LVLIVILKIKKKLINIIILIVRVELEFVQKVISTLTVWNYAKIGNKSTKVDSKNQL
jgi:hypothetical protein